ncbi:MAG: hypothetical protein RR603_06370 [Kurthia sp.]
MEHLNTIQAVTVAEKIDLFNRMHKQMMLIECKGNRRHDNALDQLITLKK